MERNDPLADRAIPLTSPVLPRIPDLTATLPRRCAGGPHRGVRHLPRGRRPLEHGHVPEGVPPGERVSRSHPRVPRRRLALQFGSGEAVLPGAGGGADRESQHVGGVGASERLASRRATRQRNSAHPTQFSDAAPAATGSTPTSTPATCSRSPTDASLSSTLGSSGASRRRPPRGCSTSCAPSRSATWAASRRR